MRSWHQALAILAAGIFCAPFSISASAHSSKGTEKEEWPALTDEERKWTKPGLNAVLLYREEHRDLLSSFSTHFYRIKVLTHEGRNYGDVEIPYARGIAELKALQARTIQPDGSVVPFQGQAFDKTLVRARKVRISSRSFSFPDVQAGSILEYRYRLEWKHEATPTMRWVVDHPLATRRARFSVKRYSSFPAKLGWITNRLVAKPVYRGENVVLEVEDIPPFHAEELMPPEREARPSLEFYYEFLHPGEKIQPVKAHPRQMLDSGWTRFAMERGEWVDKFMGKDHSLRETVAGVTALADPPETKLRKLYGWVQKIRNLTYQPPRDKAEQDKLEENKTAEDVLRRGYAEDRQINILFAALARAAGFQTWVVLTTDRERTYFSPQAHMYSGLSETLALVKVGGQERFFDPGTLYCPFGAVSWEKTGMQGLRLVKKGGLWVDIPLPAEADTQIQRILRLHSIEAGGLEGELRLVFTGQEAIRRRQEVHEEDDLGRRKALEDEVRYLLSDGSSVEVRKAGPWDQSEPALEAELHVIISGVVARTAHRLIVPLSVLRAGNLPPLYRRGRIHDVDLGYSRQERDEVHLHLPDGYEVASLPAACKIESDFALFETKYQAGNGEVLLERQETMSGVFFPIPHYARLLDYFDATRIADEDRTILHVAKAR